MKNEPSSELAKRTGAMAADAVVQIAFDVESVLAFAKSIGLPFRIRHLQDLDNLEALWRSLTVHHGLCYCCSCGLEGGAVLEQGP
jgi:hypothetical protein